MMGMVTLDSHLVAPTKLGPLVSIVTGKLDSNAATTDGEYPFFTCGQETLRTGTFSFDCECVLLAGNNANGVFPIKFFRGKFDAYQRTYVIRSVASQTLDNRYLYYALQPKLDFLKRVATGATTKFLTLGILRDIEVPLPPLPIQRKIAAILSAYDDLIENNTRRIALLEAMAQALYREWFVRFRFPGHQSVPLVDSPLGPTPQGWRVVKLGDVASEIRRGVDPVSLDPETPYVGLEHMPRKSIALSDWGTASEVDSTKLIFRKGEILFGKIRPYFHKVVVAPIDGICSTDAIVIVPRSEDLFPTVLGCVSSDEFVSHATQTSQGTKMPRANWDVLTQYQLALPDEATRRQFDDVISDAIAQIENLVFGIRNLRRTRDLLLPKLISGEVDVSEMEIVVGE